MVDLAQFQAKGEAFQNRLGMVLGIERSDELLLRMFTAAVGDRGLDLYRAAIFYANQADICRSSGSFFAADLMIASAIEALLTFFALICVGDVQKSIAYRGFSKGKTFEERLFHATFDKFIALAIELEWVPSDVVDTEILKASIQDFPVALAGLFPRLSPEERAKKAEAFALQPGIEMLRILQDLRNLIHPSRCARLGVEIHTPHFEHDCKFVFVVSFQVMVCLFTAITRRSEKQLSDFENLPQEMKSALKGFAEELVSQGNPLSKR
jgi:hypothetical protein